MARRIVNSVLTLATVDLIMQLGVPILNSSFVRNAEQVSMSVLPQEARAGEYFVLRNVLLLTITNMAGRIISLLSVSVRTVKRNLRFLNVGLIATTVVGFVAENVRILINAKLKHFLETINHIKVGRGYIQITRGIYSSIVPITKNICGNTV